MHATPSFVRLSADGPGGAGLGATTHDPSDTALEGAREPRAHTAYRDASGGFSAGVWACDAGTLQIVNLAIHEVCFLIAGRVDLTDMGGRCASFHPGDAFVLPKGFCGTWHMPEPIVKFNAMYAGDA